MHPEFLSENLKEDTTRTWATEEDNMKMEIDK
jgi:hypothetical protein